ncbi:YtcA family lipoprotein [Chitiniphilus eburneus]|nr:YtcA family lipoprotein [Chitiniphilus eburneus]
MHKKGIAAASLFLAGCARAPSINVLGAFFPDWLFCIVGGIFLTLLIRLLIRRLGWARHLAWPGLVYASLTVLTTLVIWLIVFQA